MNIANKRRVLYVGISGVLHRITPPYDIHGRPPRNDNHQEYEGVPVLEAALAGWADASIVLITDHAWADGLEPVRLRLGSSLAERVIGSTYKDLTTKARFGPRQLAISAIDYRHMMRSEVVRAHVEWLQPAAWLAINDEAAFWTTDERRARLVATDGSLGLLEERVQHRLIALLAGNFGLPDDREGRSVADA